MGLKSQVHTDNDTLSRVARGIRLQFQNQKVRGFCEFWYCYHWFILLFQHFSYQFIFPNIQSFHFNGTQNWTKWIQKCLSLIFLCLFLSIHVSKTSYRFHFLCKIQPILSSDLNFIFYSFVFVLIMSYVNVLLTPTLLHIMYAYFFCV